MRGAQGRMGDADKADQDANNMAMSQALGAFRGDTTATPNPADMESGLGSNYTQEGTGQNVNAMAQSLMGSGRDGYDKLGLAMLAREPGEADKPSALADKLIQMGLTPGTKEWQDMATQLSTMSRAPVANITNNMGSGLEKGYYYKDPNDPSQGATYVEGGSKDPAVIAAREKAKKLAGAAVATAEKGFETVDKIRTNLYNLNEALHALESGAQVGPIAQHFPSVRQATILFENAANRMGLDIVGAVTFGALSAGELKLAKAVAMPPGLEEAEQRDWIRRKIDAQEKLAGYLEKQSVFLSQPGNTQAMWQEKIDAMKAVDPRVGGKEPTITTQEEFNALPAGAWFIEDGERYLKE